MLYVNGVPYQTTNINATSVDFADYNSGTYTLNIKAIGNGGNILDSDFMLEDFEATKLAYPNNLRIETDNQNNYLVWDEVLNASAYALTINDAEPIIVEQNRYVLQVEAGSYSIRVRALGDSTVYINSNYSSLYTTTKLASVNNLTVESSDPHNMGYIPIIQCLNNDDAFGDIHCVTDLLDSLSLAVSNSTDNLQSIANAILAVSGAQLNEENIKLLNQTKVGNLPAGCTMEWVIKNIDPTAEQQQIDNLLNFIFQIAQVPDLTDDAFAGNQSGVAMQYKLWGLDQLWVTKTTKYKKAIVQRLKILMHLLQHQFTSTVQMLDEINITFDKNLPRDNSAEYTMVNTLKDVVSKRTLLENISIVDDVEEEIKALDEEAAKNADLYGFNNNVDLDGGENAEEQE